MVGFPAALLERIKARQAVLVAGLGFAEQAGLPGWDELCSRLCAHLPGDAGERDRRLVEDLRARGRGAAATALLRARLGPDAVAAILREAYGQPRPVPEVVMRLAGLGFPDVLTTSFDSIWDRAMATLTERPYQRLTGADLAAGTAVAGSGRTFLHVFGSADEPASLCLAPLDLRRREGAAGLASFVAERFRERSFVFLGFAPGDPDLELLVARLLGGAASRLDHYLVYSSSAGGNGAGAVIAADLELVAVPVAVSLPEIVKLVVEATTPPARPSAPPPVPIAAFGILAASPEQSGREAAAALLREAGDHAGLVRELRVLADTAVEADKGALLEQIGDVYQGHLGSSVQAIASYRSALAREPGRRSVILKLCELYTGHKHWRAAVEMKVLLAENETAPEARARLFYEGALIERQELDSPERSADLLSRALGDAPAYLDAFEALEKILRDVRNHQGLARLYREMLKRLPSRGNETLALRLWSGIGELAQGVLSDRAAALAALENAAALDPSNVERQVQLAGLYLETGSGHVDKAIEVHQRLIAHEPDRLASYRALADLYKKTGSADKLWCVAATLSFLRRADPDLREIYERGRGAGTVAPQGKLPRELWPWVTHPDEDARLAALFSFLSRYAAEGTAESLSEASLRRQDKVDLPRDGRAVGSVLLAVSRALELSVPDLFVSDGGKSVVGLRNLQDDGAVAPALVVATALAERGDEAELTFQLGRTVALLRSEKRLYWVGGTPAYADVAMRAGLELGRHDGLAGGDRVRVQSAATEMRRQIPAALLGEIETLARDVLAAKPALDIDRHLRGIELTCGRVAFVLTNDLAVAARVLSADAPEAALLPAKRRLKDLVAFSVSEPYFSARRALGVALIGPAK